MTLSDAFGLFSQGILAASLLLALGSRLFRPRLGPGTLPAAVAWGGIVVLALVVPAGGLPLAARLRGLLGDPSVVSVVLLVLALLRPGALPPAPAPRAAAALSVTAAALLYLPLVTGWLPPGLDAHALGWRPVPLLAVLGVLGVLAWIRGESRWLAVLSIALLAWGFGCVESGNLLDALVDPGLLVACAACARRREKAP